MSSAIIDGHFHLSPTRTMSRLENVQDALDVLHACGLQAICIQNIVLWFPMHLTRNPLSLLAKLREPDLVFAFGGVRFPDPDLPDKSFSYRQQVEELVKLGFDGIKLFGKPNIRQRFHEPMDSPVFDGMYDWLEERDIPVLFHVGDPREFWSEKTAPDFARQNGWIYTKPDFDTYYSEMEGLLKKHPRLRVLFPHFFFLSDDLGRLSAFLNRWETVWIDITPGSEMYRNFTGCPAKAHAFFCEFQNRIVFGTDNTGVPEGGGQSAVRCARERLDTMRDFLSGEHAFGWNEAFCGLSLPAAVCEKIQVSNFYRYIKKRRPAAVDPLAAMGYTEKMRALAADAQDEKLQEEFQRILKAYQALLDEWGE